MFLGAEDFEVLELTAGDPSRMNRKQREEMRSIIASCRKEHENWGFKDPRAALIYNLWDEELPEHRAIVVFRDPAEVWPRFKWTGRRLFHTNFNRAYSYLSRWLEHNNRILDVLESRHTPFIVLSFRALMAGNEEFEKLQDFMGRPLEDRRQNRLYRSMPKTDIFLRAADWFLANLKGLSCQNTMARLEALRRRRPQT